MASLLAAGRQIQRKRLSAIVKASLSATILLLASAPSARSATVIWKAPNADVLFGRNYEFENPLSGSERVEGHRVLEYCDADYIPGSARPYDDWQVNSSGIDGWPTEVWLRRAGHAATTQTSISGALLSVHLYSDDNDGIASIRVDGSETARIDCFSSPATTVLLIIRDTAPGPHVIEVRDMGGGTGGGDDVAIMGACVLDAPAPPPARLEFVRGQTIKDHMWFSGQPGDPNEILSLTVKAEEFGVLLDLVDVIASGTGNDSTDVTTVWLYVDADADGVVEAPGDTVIASGSYPGDDSYLTLNISPPLALSPHQSASLLIAYDMLASAPPASTFSCAATGAHARKASDGSQAVCTGLPVSGATKLVMGDLNLVPHLPIANHTWAPESTGPCSSDINEMMSLAVMAAPTGDVWWESLTLQGLGTGHDLRDICSVGVYLDTDDDGNVGPTDSLAGSGTYPEDDGTLKVAINPPVSVPAGTAVPVLIGYKMRLNTGLAGSNYRTQVISASGSMAASSDPASVVVLPVEGAQKTRDVPCVVTFVRLSATDWHYAVEPWSGPAPPAQRPGVLARVRAQGDPETTAEIRSLTLQARGDGDDRADIELVMVYGDVDKDGSIGPGDPLLGQDSYFADNGRLPVNLDPRILIQPGESCDLLIAYVPKQTGTGAAYRFDLTSALIRELPSGITGDYAGLPMASATLYRRAHPLWAQDPRAFAGASASGYEVFIGGLADSNLGNAAVADDWLCPIASPVTGFEWWGLADEAYLFTPSAFHISIWADVPAGMDEEFSHPGEVIWEYYCTDFTCRYDPTAGTNEQAWLFDTGDHYYYSGIQRYACRIEDTAKRFTGVPGSIYWLSIRAADAWISDWRWVLRTRNPVSRAPGAAVCFTAPPHGGSVWDGGQTLQVAAFPPYEPGGLANAAFRVVTAPVLRIGEVKCLASQADVLMAGEVVTANLVGSGGYVYIAEADRSGGMALAPQEGLLSVTSGDVLFLRGFADTFPMHNALFAPTEVGTGDRVEPPVPLRVNNRMSGGGQYGWQMGVMNRALGFEPDRAAGLNTIGQLVTIWGRVTFVDAASCTAWLDDGSGLWDAMHPGALGIAVAWPPGLALPSVNSFQQATGILSARESGQTGLPARLLLARDAQDIVSLL